MSRAYRHGDITFHPISEREAKELLKDNEESKKKRSSFVVALGESTGHKHLLTMEKEESLFVTNLEDGQVLMRLTAPGTISHEEHKPFTIDKGLYVKKVEREHDPFTKMARFAID